MNLEILLRGAMVGFVASVTLGPVAVMCIQRTLSKNRMSGFVSGLGAATGDSIFAMLAYFFVAIISPFIETHLMIFKIVAGVCIAGVGIYFFFKNPVVQIRKNRAGKSSLGQDYASTLALTLTNPAYILMLLIWFSTFNVGSENEAAAAATGYAQTVSTASEVGAGAQVVLGFFCGAVVWWGALTSLVGLLRGRFRPRHLLWINRCAGALITALGGAAILWAFV
jgi:threonine/homoserine/homoserine lactone efflux protein